MTPAKMGVLVPSIVQGRRLDTVVAAVWRKQGKYSTPPPEATFAGIP
jgi:hypothetical protein